MQAGRRRLVLHERLERDVLPLFAGRVLLFNLAASQADAELMAQARSEGRTIGKADGYIAAAGRDMSPFGTTGVRVLNLWEDVRDISSNARVRGAVRRNDGALAQCGGIAAAEENASGLWGGNTSSWDFCHS